MDISNIENLIQLLEQVRRRPWAYIGIDPENVIPFIAGVNMAFSTLGIVRDRKIYEDVVNERGWQYTNFKPLYQIREKITNDEQAVQEFMDIELESWRRYIKMKY